LTRQGRRGAFIYPVNEAISRLPPPVQLDDVVARELAAELANVEAALVEARKLKGLSEGRYPAALQVNGFFWGDVAALHRSREIATLLEWEAAALAHAGRTGESLATGRAVLVAARAFGDEPVLTSFIFRMAGQSQALRSIERTLAQGVPPSDELRATQELLEDEAARPLLLAALRGERAMHHRLFDTGYVVQSVPASKGASANYSMLVRHAGPVICGPRYYPGLKVAHSCHEPSSSRSPEVAAMAILLPDACELSDDVLEALRLRALRGCALGLTEVQVADLLGVARETVCRWWSAATPTSSPQWISAPSRSARASMVGYVSSSHYRTSSGS
jgi:hypothetical protein